MDAHHFAVERCRIDLDAERFRGKFLVFARAGTGCDCDDDRTAPPVTMRRDARATRGPTVSIRAGDMAVSLRPGDICPAHLAWLTTPPPASPVPPPHWSRPATLTLVTLTARRASPLARRRCLVVWRAPRAERCRHSAHRSHPWHPRYRRRPPQIFQRPHGNSRPSHAFLLDAHRSRRVATPDGRILQGPPRRGPPHERQ